MFSDTIAAIATAPGRGAISLIRISGRDALEIAGTVVQPFPGGANRKAFVARAVHPGTGEHLDQVVCLVYPSPHSYTGENVVEISTHGGLLVPASVLEALFVAGARQARAGEFTLRAVTNGKMDLLQAEAVADLIDATARAQRKAAISQLDRGLSQRIEELRSSAIELEALMSYDIDFPEEDDGPVAPERIRRAAATLLRGIESLLKTSADGETLRLGALAVIAGKPNSGKSSLFNALVGYERAIVTAVAGTTRDAIEATVSCDGFPFRLVDTAGLRESDDTVERIGVEVSRRYVDAADIVLLCVEADGEPDEGEKSFAAQMAAPVIMVRTKADLAPPPPPLTNDLWVSALSGSGLAELRTALSATAFGHLMEGADVEPGLTRARHRTALARARNELEEFTRGYDDGVEGVAVAVHVRAAVGALEEVVGVVTTEDVLDSVFAEFCVGK